jgi:hypothetical protein
MPSGKKQSGWAPNAFGKNPSDWYKTLEPNGKNVSRPKRAKCRGELKSAATRAGKRTRRGRVGLASRAIATRAQDDNVIIAK